GRAVVGLRLPDHFTVRLRGERAPYLYTEASLSTVVMTASGIVLATWSDPRGWLGEASYQLHRFPDANTVNTAYVWILAPVSHAKSGELQIGYSGAFQNASASRFVLAKPGQPFTPGDPRFDASGRYVPYYTPENQIAQAELAAAMLRPPSSMQT